MQQEIHSIKKLIDVSESILLFAHRGVDGDAYGSTMALYFFLKKLWKNVHVVNELSIAPQYHFLGFSTLVEHVIPKEKFDCIFICDCGDLRLIGKFLEGNAELFASVPMVNIDHHNRNSLFGSINLVDTSSSSTCELVYEIISNTPEYADYIDENISKFLTYWIIRDTNCFKNSIRPRTFEIASKLFAFNPMAYESIIFHTYKSESLNYLQLYGEILSKPVYLHEGRVIGGVITQEMFDRYGIQENELGPQFINEILSSIDGTDYVFLIKETADNLRKLSFRVRRKDFDVSRLANLFGGGGHRESAGAYTELPIDEIIRMIEVREVTMDTKKIG